MMVKLRDCWLFNDSSVLLCCISVCWLRRLVKELIWFNFVNFLLDDINSFIILLSWYLVYIYMNNEFVIKVFEIIICLL